MYSMLEQFWKSISLVSTNSYLQFEGGEYKSLDAYLSKFINDLRILRIELVFYVDGSGTSLKDCEPKFRTWKNRYMQDVDRQQYILQICRGEKGLEDLLPEIKLRPVLVETQFLSTLKNCGCTIHQIAVGEADPIIAHDLQTNKNAYAILSDDSDFLVFPGGAMICMRMFDINGDMKLGKAVTVPETPQSLVCNVLLSDKIMKNLGLNNSELEIAVTHSRNFYSLTHQEEDGNSDEYLHSLREGVKHGCFSSQVIRMHNGFYWHRNMVEDTALYVPSHFVRYTSSEIALVELRRYIYRIVLPSGENKVTEYGLSPEAKYSCVKVPVSDNLMVPPITLISPEDSTRNFQHFHRIMSHQEFGGPLMTFSFDRYGRRNSFICYLLRYFLVLNWRNNLHVSKSEFLALSAMVLGHLDVGDEGGYQKLVIRPSPRCVTLGNLFQNIYRHAYEFLGKLLYLTHEFPLPREIFSGSEWTAFYTCCSEHAVRNSQEEIPRDTLLQCRRDMEDVIKNNMNLLRSVTERIFEIDDRSPWCF